MYLTPRKCPWHSEFSQRVYSPPGGLREQNRLTSHHHSGQWDWWGKALWASLLFVLESSVSDQWFSHTLEVHIAKTSMLCLNVFQIVVFVKAQGDVEQYQQKKDLLPVRDFGVDASLLSALEFTVDIGPLCFLWHTQCVCVCMHVCMC